MGADDAIQRQVKLAHRNGLHLSPINTVVKKACEYKADVRVCFDGKSASARSAMDLMLLGATFGAELQLEASGDDAAAAMQAVADVLGNDLH